MTIYECIYFSVDQSVEGKDYYIDNTNYQTFFWIAFYVIKHIF